MLTFQLSILIYRSFPFKVSLWWFGGGRQARTIQNSSSGKDRQARGTTCQSPQNSPGNRGRGLRRGGSPWNARPGSKRQPLHQPLPAATINNRAVPAAWLWGLGLIRDCKSLAHTVQQGNLTHQSSQQRLAVLDSADAEILRAASDLLRLILPGSRHQP